MLDFNECAESIDLVDFIQRQFPDYKIDENKSSKSQTRLFTKDEEIDVWFKSTTKQWVYFNRTSRHKGDLKDEGNIIQFLKVRLGADNFKEIIEQLNAYLNNFSVSTLRELQKESRPSEDIKPSSYFYANKYPLNDLQADLFKDRGIPKKVYQDPRILKNVCSFMQPTKKNVKRYYLGFPLYNSKSEITGMELKAKKTPDFAGRFGARGSSKEKSFWLSEITSKTTTLLIGEDPYDLLSHMTLYGLKVKEAYLGTGGRFGVQKIEAINELAISKNITSAELKLDNDLAGRSFNIMLASGLFAQGELINQVIRVNPMPKENQIDFEIVHPDISKHPFLNTIKDYQGIKIDTSNSTMLRGSLPYNSQKIDKLIHEIIKERGLEKEIKLTYSLLKDYNEDLKQSMKTKQQSL